MKTLSISVIAVAIGLAFNSGAMAQGVSKSEYKASTDSIVAEYKAARASCGSLSANAKDVCVAEAGGKQKVAKAELAARYKPSERRVSAGGSTTTRRVLAAATPEVLLETLQRSPKNDRTATTMTITPTM